MNPTPAASRSPYEHVDPFIGTGGFGHTYPGACLPFGMVQLSPDTRISGWENCSGYHASNPTIIGFSHTHLSGTGATDLGDILFMPTTGPLQTDAGEESDPSTGYRSSFRHDTETAAPGFYSVLLDDYGIRVDLTVSDRVAFHRYVFPRAEEAHVVIDLVHGLGDRVRSASIEFESDTEVVGFRRSTGWAADHTVYFAAKFSRPFGTYGTVRGGGRRPGERRARGADVKGFVSFSAVENETVLVKVGISPVSVAGARRNLKAEVPDWDFDAVRETARARWNEALSCIRLHDESDERRTVFYTALYHTMLCPNLYTDVDGRYRGADGRVHRSKDSPIYTNFSLWDTFRAAHPLLTIISPDRDAEFIRSLVSKYAEAGHLPVWELHANETNCMIGYHAVPVIVDAYVKGIRDFDVAQAYEAMKESARRDHRGLDSYRTFGYIPSNKENESVSKTLEYAYDDWCIAELAALLGRGDDRAEFARRAKSYANLYDASSGFMRAKKDGNWVNPFDPNEVTVAYTEATAWQYRFFVPHDLDTLIALTGGDEKFIECLDSVFAASPELRGRELPDITGLIGQYAHGNEPSHHMAYLYDYAGAPWKAQERVHEIGTTLYTTGREGLCGNEDCGQMSAWYVLSAMGFYPVCPGRAEYAIGKPLIEKAEIDVGGGKLFAISTKGLSPTSRYIARVWLNSEPYTKSFLRHSDIMAGGELVFELAEEPQRDWGSGLSDRPASVVADLFVTNPFYVSQGRSFYDSTEIEIRCYTPGAEIHYTTNGETPSKASPRYAHPLRLDRSATLKAIAYKAGMHESFVESVDYVRVPCRRTIVYDHAYHPSYTAGGDNGLLDGIRGEASSFAEWQGFLGVDLAATIDLGEERTIRRISSGFLQDSASSIFLPSSVEYLVSRNRSDFKSVGKIANAEPLERAGAFARAFEKRLRSVRARYVRIVARNVGVNPSWHPGAGQKAFLFADEIVIE